MSLSHETLGTLTPGERWHPANAAAAAAWVADRAGVAPAPTPGRCDVPTWLPFTVERVRGDASLRQAVAMRHAAYARHVSMLAAQLKEPEPADWAPGTVVLLARSKLDGSALGTLRIQTNAMAPLPLEHSVALPAAWRAQHLAEATRLGVAAGVEGGLVKAALFKALYLHCRANGVDQLVIACRSPLDRHYRRLLFREVLEPGRLVPMKHAAGLPHHILALDLASARARWAAADHPLLGFMCEAWHPDLLGDDAVGCAH